MSMFLEPKGWYFKMFFSKDKSKVFFRIKRDHPQNKNKTIKVCEESFEASEIPDLRKYARGWFYSVYYEQQKIEGE